jgi:large subunit ribosomal protein L17
MRHKKGKRKLKRNKSQRKALLKSLSESLILKEKIKTTEVKAKELRSYIEKEITRAKKGNLAAVRFLRKNLTKKTSQKLMASIESFKGRNSGYTRVIKVGERKSDGAKMAIIELIKDVKEKEKKNENRRKK